MENPNIGQLVTYKGKKYKVNKDLGNGRYRIKCAVGCPKTYDVFQTEITPA
jgi:hypothetical protein